MCEHKGIGHPDSICDGAAEAVSSALCRAYLDAYGAVQHYNVDKALLVGGESAPRFGGGRLLTPLRLIVCGRATPLPGVDLAQFVQAAAQDYLAAHLRCDPSCFIIESAVRGGSPNLQRVLAKGTARPRANDTSFGAGFAPFSPLESIVLKAASLLRSWAFREAFPAAGDDYKVMGARIGDELHLTVALAIVDQHVRGIPEYFDIKSGIAGYLHDSIGFSGPIAVNALDDPRAADESGVYLTVTGLSAEHGDDGQVGRGNRVNGLITPGRPMSLEAAAGKNSLAHVGKLYNLLAHQIAQDIAAAEPTLHEVTVQMLSTIGKPVDEPELVAIRLVAGESGNAVDREALGIACAKVRLQAIDQLSADLVAGRVSVF
ncbi:MAG: methionine adenosyltransferase [Nevskia sp.]|nr:methionine adenosyltransferase [Nevskia sp.]